MELGIGYDAVQLQVSEETDWPDSCLGAPSQDEACAEVITPGYMGVLIVEGNLYEFHSDRSGENVRFIPGAALSARQILAGQLALEQTAIRLVSFEKVEWPDGCLGVETSGQVCTQGVVPGYRVVLKTDGETYEFHVDETGGIVRLANAPKAKVSDKVLVWSQTSDGLCDTATIGMDSLLFGMCQGAMVKAVFVGKGRADELEYFNGKYLPFDADTPSGKISFTGKGSITATPSEQRMIAEWARLVNEEALSGRAGASWGLIYTWHREGGIAGFCDDVAIYVDGITFASSCQGGQPENLGKIWLTSNQMRSLYTWVETLESFEDEHTDSATADAMTVRMVFTGNGQETVTDFEKIYLSSLAEEIVVQLRAVPNPANLEKARQALTDYFSALTAKNYPEAVALYGGSYEVLQNNNPALDQTDYPALFEAGCTFNGYVCDLKIKNIAQEVQLSETDFRFTVEMESSDGSLFVLGPCCGADPQDEPPWTQFDFLVKKVNGKFLVQDLPVYVP